MVDIKELVGGTITFVIGLYILLEITAALSIPQGSLIIAFFIIAGVIWFIKEALGQ